MKYLKTAAAERQIDLHPDVAEYLQKNSAGKTGLLFHAGNSTPHRHAFKRFRKTWRARCLEDINNFWLAHKPQAMSEVYSHLHEELQLHLDEATRVGYGFTLPASNASVVPIVAKLHQNKAEEKAA